MSIVTLALALLTAFFFGHTLRSYQMVKELSDKTQGRDRILLAKLKSVRRSLFTVGACMAFVNAINVLVNYHH